MASKLKTIIANNSTVMRLAAWVYNKVHYNNSWRFKAHNKISYKSAFLRNVRFNVSGKNNIILIGPKARLNNCSIVVYGNNCKFLLGGGSTIVSGTSFWIQDDNTNIEIGNHFMAGDRTHIAACEGASIRIGEDCMLSEDVEMRSSDSHSIFDTISRKRTNKAREINIGNHVWLTAHVRIMKGTTIADHSIVGNSSLVSGRHDVAHGLYAGNPCKLLKEHVDWNKYKLDEMPAE